MSVVAFAARPHPTANQPQKDLYEVGEIPPLGHVPKNMYAWVIRRDRHGPPEQSMQLEVVPTHAIGEDEVLVLVMAAGVNYNGVWAGLGLPISPFDVHKQPFHIAGSDAAGIVWAIGAKVKRWKVGDEVVVHCNQDDGDDEECNGGDPMFSTSQRIWGYETPDGSFAQFCKVQARQLMKRPPHLTWEESASYTLTLATAYRMLFGHRPHILRPGHNVLVWGAAGGLGSMAIQLIATAGANAIGVISDPSKKDFVMSLGAKGVVNRNDFECWGHLPRQNGGGELRSILQRVLEGPQAGALGRDEHRHVSRLVQVLPHLGVGLGNVGPVEHLAHAGIDAALDHELVGLARLQQVGEVAALDALLTHPHEARVHGEVVAGGAGAEDDHAAALHDVA